MRSLYWIGKYESDIENCSIFTGAITYYGRNEGANYAFCKNDIRINYIISDEFKKFVVNSIKRQLAKDINCRFMFYSQSLAHEIIALYPMCSSYIIGLNPFSLIDTLNNKLYNRLWFSNILDIIPIKILAKTECYYENVKSIFPDFTRFIIQKNISSGGRGTYLLTSDSESNVLRELSTGELYVVSPYIEKSYSINIHGCITDTCIVKFPMSIQITKLIDNKILFCGSDYIATKNIPNEIKSQINSKIDKIFTLLKSFGYKGILGIDLLIAPQQVYFIEINPRFQGSSLPLNQSLMNNKLPSLYELHLAAFENSILDEIIEKIENLNVNFSLLIYKCFSNHDDLSDLYVQMKKNDDLFKLYDDGYHSSMHVNYNAHIFRVIITKNICYINPDNRINLVENLMNNEYLNFPIKNVDGIITLKIALLVQGVKLSKAAYNYISKENPVKNATFNAIDISVFHGLKINCPINIPFSELSPYHIEYDAINKLQLYYKHFYVSTISVDTNENLLDKKTISGIPYSRIGFKTNDRVRIRHTSLCYFKEHNQSCSFCESKHIKQYNFSDSDIFEVIDAYEKEVNFRHYLIGGGSENIEIEPERIKRIIQYIRKKSSKPIYLMSLPPKDISHIYDYYQLGLNEVAFNIEIYNRKIAAAIMPGKGKIPLNQYLNALEESTKYFGKTGNVRSMLIVGLEQENSLIAGVKRLCSIGVSPMLSVFRPMPLTSMNYVVPPTIEDIKSIYKIADNICKKYNLFLGPTCEQCQNNTLSLAPQFLKIECK